MMPIIRLIFLTILLALVAACAPVASKMPVSDLQQQWRTQQQQLNDIGSWQLQAKTLVRSERQALNVTMRWQHAKNDERIRLFLPLGRGTVQLRQTPAGAVLIDQQGKIYRGATMTGLLWQQTGVEIPFNALQKWLLGAVEDIHNPTVEVDEHGRTMRFQSGDWQLQYPAYMPAGEGDLALPRKIYVYNTRMGADFALKLSVQKWQLGQ